MSNRKQQLDKLDVKDINFLKKLIYPISFLFQFYPIHKIVLIISFFIKKYNFWYKYSIYFFFQSTFGNMVSKSGTVGFA